MNEEITGKCLWQVEHSRGYLRHRYSITGNEVVVAIVKLSKISKRRCPSAQPFCTQRKNMVWLSLSP